jgi:photosystem II stability/assembly factor-like uncharacterized protein
MSRLPFLSPSRLLTGLAFLALMAPLPFTGRLAGQAQTPVKEKPVATPAPLALPADWVKTMTWRCIGPATMGGRIISLAVYEADPSTWWVATASGGLLKTTNNGITFEHQFDHENTVSVGDVAVAPSDRNIVWVGTGENNPRNSVSYGDGVYKSTNGGKTWQNMGLKKSFQIGRIAIHPRNPDIVYVGALGRLYGPSEERGLFKTTDGGKTWKKVLYVDEKTGIIDLRMNPGNPETLLAATYERQRDIYDVADPMKKWGTGSGLWKTMDGGKTWKKLTKGLPGCKLGRIGIDYYRKNPDVVFAIVESEKIGMGPPQVARNTVYMGITGQDARGGGAELLRVTQGGPADKAGLQPGDVITGLDAKPVRNYEDLIDQIRTHKPGDKVKVSRRRAREMKVVDLTLTARGAQGGQAGRPFAISLGGQRENVQDRQGKDGHDYGGLYRSDNGGKTWKRINSINPRPMYFSQIRVDPTDDRYLYVLGISLYRSQDGGKTFRPDGGRGVHADQHTLWIDPHDGRHMLLGCDGGLYATYDRMEHWDHLNTTAIAQFYHVALDTRRNYWVYGGLQDNGSWGGPSFRPGFTGPVNEDWIRVGGGDGFTCQVDPNDPDQIYYTAQYGRMGRRNLRTREAASFQPRGRYRFNWSTPFLLSHHNSKIFYAAGNVVFRSLDRGNNLKPISKEITATDRGSALALAESPKNASVLWVGTDDGFLWVTRDGGKEWTNVTKNVGLPGLRSVSSIEASRFGEGRAYVVFDGHRSDDDRPYVYATEDFGKTWKPLHGMLPKWGTTRVLREDIENPDLLYLGTEFAIWCSIDRGQTWHRLNNNLPTVAIHEIAIHPSAGEIVAATHGRSLWILDVTPLRQLTKETLASATLYKPVTAIRWLADPSRGGTNRRFVGENPARGAALYYSLPARAKNVSLKVVDINGKTVRDLRIAADAGLHRIPWDLAGNPPRGNPRQPRPGGGRRFGGGPRGRPVPDGTYRIVLVVDDNEQSQTLKVEADPTAPPGAVAVDEIEEAAQKGEQEEDREEREGRQEGIDD